LSDSASINNNMAKLFLILNAGSSSLKFALYRENAARLERILSGSIDRLGQADSEFKIKATPGSLGTTRQVSTENPASSIELILDEVRKISADVEVSAVGHRVVHGGPTFTAPQIVNRKLIDALRDLSPFDPEHLPAEIALIKELQRRLPKTPQVACFDTAFHHDLPRVAQLLPIPRRYVDAGVRRYGFHGLSYEFLLGEMVQLGESSATKGRVILAHLGNGASLAAVRDGHCIDTTMGFTPAAGLVMGSRSGDLDPGLMAYLAQKEKMSPAGFDRLVNYDSGLRGISETSSDMRELLAHETADVRAAEAVTLFCYQAKKWVGSFVAALGGLDALVFSAGIGENCAPVRARICDGFGFLGVELDSTKNSANAAIISTAASRVVVRVIRTDEELMIARHVRDVIPTGLRQTSS
jgi:acetate kinase